MTLNIPTISNQYSLRIPAHRFRQGGRDVYYFALDLETLDGLLPLRVEDKVVRDANRSFTSGHAKDIQRYLDEKDDWLLGALMLGIAPDAMDFDPYPNEQGAPGNPNFGELRIRANRANTIRIFDGQHRRHAIRDILTELSNAGGDGRADKLDSLRRASMTVILYAEDDISTLRQMFVDASKNKRIEGHTITRFDQRDAFNLAAVWLANNSHLFKGRVEMERSSTSSSSQHLLAVNQLAAVLKSLDVGYGRRVSRDLNDAYMQDLDGLYGRCRVWSDEFMPAAREEYGGLVSGEIDNSEIPHLRFTTFAYNIAFIRVLAGCYRLWMGQYASWEPLADFISKALISHGSGHGLLVDAGLVSPDGTTLFARRQEVANAIDYIIREARVSSEGRQNGAGQSPW